MFYDNFHERLYAALEYRADTAALRRITLLLWEGYRLWVNIRGVHVPCEFTQLPDMRIPLDFTLVDPLLAQTADDVSFLINMLKQPVWCWHVQRIDRCVYRRSFDTLTRVLEETFNG